MSINRDFNPRPRTVCTGIKKMVGKTRTMQEFEPECNINTVIARYRKTGRLPQASSLVPLYGDFSLRPESYADGIIQLRQAQAEFNGLPASIRARFENDPQKLLKFLHDSNNRAEAEKLGLLKPEIHLEQSQVVNALKTMIAGIADPQHTPSLDPSVPGDTKSPEATPATSSLAQKRGSK